MIRDELRRRAIAAKLGESGATRMLEWTADREAKAIDTAICLGDDLPGGASSPATNAREVGVVPVLVRIPYLFGDRIPPAAPAAPTVTPGGAGIVVLRWPSGGEPDLAGYRVYRSATTERGVV